MGTAHAQAPDAPAPETPAPAPIAEPEPAPEPAPEPPPEPAPDPARPPLIRRSRPRLHQRGRVWSTQQHSGESPRQLERSRLASILHGRGRSITRAASCRGVIRAFEDPADRLGTHRLQLRSWLGCARAHQGPSPLQRYADVDAARNSILCAERYSFAPRRPAVPPGLARSIRLLGEAASSSTSGSELLPETPHACRRDPDRSTPRYGRARFSGQPLEGARRRRVPRARLDFDVTRSRHTAADRRWPRARGVDGKVGVKQGPIRRRSAPRVHQGKGY